MSTAFMCIFGSVPCQATSPLSPQELQIPFAVQTIKPDPVRNVVYILDGTDNLLIAVNTDTGVEVNAAAVEDGDTIGEMAISIDDTKLYLAESAEDKILVFSLPTLTPLPSIPLDFPPTSIVSAVNGRLFATESGGDAGNAIVEIDRSDGSILNTFGSLQDFYYTPLLRVSADGMNLYAGVTSLSGFLDIYEYSLSGSQISGPTGYEYESENMIDFAPDDANGRIYVMNGGIYGVNVILKSNDNFSTVWPLTGAYGVAISYNASSNVVFAASGDPYHGDVKEFSRTDGAPIADWVVATDADPIQAQGLAATANGNAVYVRSPDGDISQPPCFLGFISATGHPITLSGSTAQTITFNPVVTGTAGQQITLSATASSGLPVTYQVVSGPATISGNDLTFTGTGTVVISATQSGSPIYATKTITQSVTVSLATQVISGFSVIPDHTYLDPVFSVIAPATSSGLLAVVTVKSGPATISGSMITLTGAGAVTLAANQAGNGIYAPAPEVTTSFVVNKAAQTINPFATIPTKNSDGISFPITLPVSTAGLPVTVSVLSGPATLNGTTVTLTGRGTVVLAADQAGNSNYLAATRVTTQFAVIGSSQTITAFKTIPAQSYSPVPFTITAPTASSGLLISVSVLSGPATISGTNVTLTGVGTVTLAANQSGNSTTAPAPQVTTSFVVKQASQSITPFGVIASQSYGAAPFVITPPTASSGLPVTISVKSGPATILGDTVTVTGIGKVVLEAFQAGSANYLAAPAVSTTFVVGKETQTITAFNTISTQTYGAAPFAINLPMPSSGLPISVAVKSGPAKLSGTMVTLTGAGTVVLAADQAGNALFAAAPEVIISFVVNKAPQTIAALAPVMTQTFGEAAFPVTPPVASSGLAVTLKILSGPASIRLNRVTLTGAGTVILAADQVGNALFAAAPEVITSFTVNPEAQTIAAFRAIKPVVFSVAPFAVSAPAATSRLPVVISVLSGPATIINGKVTVSGVGTVVLAADQSGDANFEPASEVTTSFTVTKASQTISRFGRIGIKTAGSAPFTITLPTASSGLPVTVTVLSGPATISGDTITLSGMGAVVLTANQTGNADYYAAAEATTSFTVR